MKPPERARLLSRQDVTESLAIFRIELDGDVPDFLPGQFLTLGVPPETPDTEAWRTYSVASPPSEKRFVELFIRHPTAPLPGRLTTSLWHLAPGALLHHRGIAGAFTVSDTLPGGKPDRRTLLLLGAGTGVSPFLSIAREMRRTRPPREILLVHGASYRQELAYTPLLEEIERETRDVLPGAFRLRHVPTVSRPDDPLNAGWRGETGRVEDLLTCGADGSCRLDELAGEPLRPERFMAHACGHGGSVRALVEALAARGFVTARHRHSDGSFDIKVETYG